MIAPTPPDHGGICLAQCAVTHQLTPIGRWIEQRGDLGFGQLLSAHHSFPLHVETGRPADPGQGVDERAALDAEDAANRGLGGAAVERRDHRCECISALIAGGRPTRRRWTGAAAFSLCLLTLQKWAIR